MSEIKKANKTRRSIVNSARTNVLHFHEKDAVTVAGPAFGLFTGHLDKIEVRYSTIAEDTKGLQSFAGKVIPRLVLRFTSNHKEENQRRVYTQSFIPVESNIDTIPGGSKAWQVDNIFTWMRNILDLYILNGRELTEEENDALTLSFEDIDDNNMYVPVEVDDVIDGYKDLFENFAAMMNGQFGKNPTGKPVYFTEKGTIIPLWMKLTRHIKSRDGWKNTGSNGELAFDVFYRTPLIEKYYPNALPKVVMLDLSKESITPKETKKAPSIGAAGIPGMPGGVVIPSGMPDGINSDSAAGMDAGEEMPF
uniref:Capsid protein n=1 Tax=Geladintestivirus 1 TaxID=3233133 RepID=A0AAU8MKF5_9CAUD